MSALDLFLTDPERKTVDGVWSLLAGMAGAGLFSGLRIGDFVAELRGDRPASELTDMVARFILKMAGHQPAYDAIVRMFLSKAAAAGADAEGVSSLIHKVAPLLRVELNSEYDSTEQLVGDTLNKIACNVVNANPRMLGAVVVCPRCQYAHAV